MGLEESEAGASAHTRCDSAEAERSGGSAQQDNVAEQLSGLLIELGQKVREAGADGVRILTAAEVERGQLEWFREGWQEHARAVGDEVGRPGGHELDEGQDTSPGRLLRFPDRPDERQDTRRELPAPGEQHPLPLVRAREATVQELMPHRPREAREPSAPPPVEHVRPQPRPAPE
ncbi:hypothetical protein [Streptomyces sp. NPDC046939]|uniref:hypothetical protein n=1 Tax=Streptomyces sp. NPDC046939 TaxID=3155376 RepID=UPI0033C6B9AF